MGATHEPVLMICSQELRSYTVDNPSRKEHPGDRIVVTKFIRPQRWDVIVFRLPEDPKICYCKRLVGLPENVMAHSLVVLGYAAEQVQPLSRIPRAILQTLTAKPVASVA